MSKPCDADVAIIGAGFAGTCAAHALSRLDARIVLIDRRDEMGYLFRAEKIEVDQARIMRSLGLLGFRAPTADVVGEIITFDGTVRQHTGTIEQYGIDYTDTVNTLRDHLPASVERLTRRVVAVEAHDAHPAVRFDDGDRIQAKLVIIATAGSDGIMRSLDLDRDVDTSLRSLSFGCDIERVDGSDFPFNGFNYVVPPGPATIDYITIFPIGARTRANVFTQLRPKDEMVQAIRNDFVGSLDSLFPGIFDHIGQIRTASSVHAVPTVYRRLNRPARPGVVVVGEEFQSVSPTTGRGLSKVLTDVDVLCSRHAPVWLESDRVNERRVREFYADKDKRKSDREALGAWMHYRNRMMGPRPPTRRLTDRLKLLGWLR